MARPGGDSSEQDSDESVEGPGNDSSESVESGESSEEGFNMSKRNITCWPNFPCLGFCGQI